MVDCQLCGLLTENPAAAVSVVIVCATQESSRGTTEAIDPVPDNLFCSSCELELLNWFRGYSEARSAPLLKRSRDWLAAEAALCYLCGEAPAEHIEHLHPRVHGGPDRLPNVGLACAHCNGVKGARLVELDAGQTLRFREQQAEFARRYADVQRLIPAVWLQRITREYWQQWGHDVDGFELGDAVPSWAGDIVAQEVQWELELQDQTTDPPPYLPDDWAQRAVEVGVPILNLYSQREWFDAPLAAEAAREVMTAAVDELSPPCAP